MGANPAAAIARGIYHLFLGNIAATLLLAVATVVVGRVLGPSDYGLYAIALIVPPFLFNAIRLGLDAAVTRYGARMRSEGREEEALHFVYSNTIFQVTVGAAFTIVFILLSGEIASRVLDRPGLGGFVLPLAMLSVLGEAAYTMTNQGLTGLGKYDWVGVLQALQGLTRLVVAALLVIFGFGVAGAAAGYTAGWVVSGFIGLVALANLAGVSPPRAFRGDVAAGLRYGFPVYFSVMATAFVLPAVTTLLALTVSNAQVGAYSAAVQFNTVILLFTYPITTGLFPLFSQKVQNLDSVGRVYGITLRFTAILVVPLASFIMAFAGPLILTFYGPAYGFGTLYLAMLAAIALLAGLGSQAYVPLLNGFGHTRDALLATAVGSAISVAAAVALVQWYGVPGAIGGQILGQGAALLIGTLIAGRRLHVRLELPRVWKTYAAAGGAAAVCYPLTWIIPVPAVTIGVGAVLFFVLYVPLLSLLGALHQEDIDTLRRYLGFSPLVARPLDLAIRYYEGVRRAVSRRPLATA